MQTPSLSDADRLELERPLPASTPTVYLCRHGDTAYNSGHTSPEKFRGHADVPLSAEGRQEAKDLAHLLEDYGIDAVYCSDLSRATDTGNAIGQTCNCPVYRDKRLRPWDLGELTGKPVKDGIEKINFYAKQKAATPLPGGESFNAFKSRFLTALDDILEKAESQHQVIAIVAHSRNLQLSKASNAVPGRLENHQVSLRVFSDYSNETSTGDVLVLQKPENEWKITGRLSIDESD